MYLLHAIDSDRQTRLLNVLEQIAMYWEEKKIRCLYKKIIFRLQRVQCHVNGWYYVMRKLVIYTLQ